MRIAIRIVSAAVLLSAAFASSAALAQLAAPDSFVVSNVRLFDGERVSERRNVVIRDGRILQIGDADLLPEGVEVIEGEGRTLLPALIDSHVHLGADPKPALSQSLSLGVTTVTTCSAQARFFRP